MVKVKRSKRKLVAEINVVPYIDVMLVLLVVFMATAPLLIQGVNVELPEANSAPVDVDSVNQQSLIVSVKDDGSYWLDIQGKNTSHTLPFIRKQVAKVMAQQPHTTVLVWGDAKVHYGVVIDLMNELQLAGASSVGLVTEPPNHQR